MSSKSILIISRYTISKLVRFLRHDEDLDADWDCLCVQCESGTSLWTTSRWGWLPVRGLQQWNYIRVTSIHSWTQLCLHLLSLNICNHTVCADDVYIVYRQHSSLGQHYLVNDSLWGFISRSQYSCLWSAVKPLYFAAVIFCDFIWKHLCKFQGRLQ